MSARGDWRAGLPGGRWAGGLLFLTVLMATSYYTVVIGWLLLYLLRTLTTGLGGVDASALFAEVTGDLPAQAAATARIGYSSIIRGARSAGES